MRLSDLAEPFNVLFHVPNCVTFFAVGVPARRLIVLPIMVTHT